MTDTWPQRSSWKYVWNEEAGRPEAFTSVQVLFSTRMTAWLARGCRVCMSPHINVLISMPLLPVWGEAVREGLPVLMEKACSRLYFLLMTAVCSCSVSFPWEGGSLMPVPAWWLEICSSEEKMCQKASVLYSQWSWEILSAVKWLKIHSFSSSVKLTLIENLNI